MISLEQAKIGVEYRIGKIETDDKDLDSFLFSLGCYEGEPIAVVRHLKSSCIVAIKNGRYNMDKRLAQAILVNN